MGWTLMKELSSTLMNADETADGAGVDADDMERWDMKWTRMSGSGR